MKQLWHTFLALVFWHAGLMTVTFGQENADQKNAEKLFTDGNFAEAYSVFRDLSLKRRTAPEAVAAGLPKAAACLQNLNRLDELDDYVEAVIARYKKRPRVLEAAALQYRGMQHYGYLVGGEFHRGHHRGGGRWMNVQERDRVRSLQLFAKALSAVQDGAMPDRAYAFYMAFASAVGDQYHGQSWRLQALTDLEKLPEIGAPPTFSSAGTGAPVDPDGNPVYYNVPDSFVKAQSDGERWRWLLAQAERVAIGADIHRPKLMYARFLQQQFGVQTLQSFGAFRGGQNDELGGIFAVHTLEDNETIAKLATGVKRFVLPEESNHLKILQAIARSSGDRLSTRGDAISILADIYENRRQYEKAVTWWEQYIPFSRAVAEKQIRQITGNWGRFEPVQVQPAGHPATVEFTFRNAHSANFTAREVDLEKLLADVRDYVESKPERIDWQRVDLGDIGRRLVWENQEKYLGREVATWELALAPREGHFDRRITVTTPLRNAGAYLVTCSLKDGNTSRIVLSLADTVIVRKQLHNAILYYVADARSGKPVNNCELDFFGYRQERMGRSRKFSITTKRFEQTTDKNGQFILNKDQQLERFQWFVTAATDDGRLAYHGFTGLGFPQYHDQEYKEIKSFVVTDRPVYRPDQSVFYKVWVRHAKYDLESASLLAGKEIHIMIRNPKGDTVSEETVTADEYGGVDGKYILPEDAPLGNYSVQVSAEGHHRGGLTFRVEEYKKPEFEVKIEAPSEPVMLGETIPVTVRANYYFGAPVTNAEVKVKVLRYSHQSNWYPAMPWDWLYGPGYWWFTYDYDWYPGWQRWGCFAPAPWWYPRRHDPPEVVAETTGQIGEDGTFSIDVDTALAKELYGDQDHRYEVTSEVRDESRRTIVGKGQVLVAREPFRVYAWTDRGHYRLGDTIRASFQARTLDGKGVQGKGVLRLLRVTYGEDMLPNESEVQSWNLDTDASGTISQKLTASRPGQYRLSFTLIDGKGRSIEGGYLFVVQGEGRAVGDYRFNGIELIPDDTAYSPGDTVRLMVNTDQPDSTVLIFTRAANGICLSPETLSLKGKSTVYEIKVLSQDMPNFFVEAVTVADGKVHSAIREIVVPPVKRVLNVDVLPSKARFSPGEKGRVRIKLTDMQGKPFKGTTTIAVYDKSVEYISGGSNIPEIRAFFWKWRRRHNEQIFHTLNEWFHNALKRGEESMTTIGAFGHIAALDGGADFGAMGGGMGGRPMLGMAAPRRMMKAKGERMEGMAVAAAPAMAMEATADSLALGVEAEKAPGEPEQGLVEPTVRSSFADTALWVATLETDAAGMAETVLPMPENLTTWKIRVWGVSHGTRVGEGTAEVITSKDLIIRMQAPRFFVETDEVVLSANIHNYLPTEEAVTAVLELDGPCLDVKGREQRKITVPSQGEERVDWRVRVLREGEAVIRMKALGKTESDAMEMRFPVYVHGMDKMESYCGVLRPEDTSGTITIDVPKERRPENSRLELRFSPTLAMAMVDALPYLVSYPYGCTEQTLNRFLPSVITQNTLQRMGVSLAEIRDKLTNLNAQELGDADERAAQWRRYDHNPVFDETELAKMVRQGVEDLTNMQLSDGGWGWFSGYGEYSYPHTTATVVHGLQVAVENDVTVSGDVLQRGISWLETYQKEQIQRLKNAEEDPKVKPWKDHADNLDACVFRVLADADIMVEAMRDYLYRDRNMLSVYGKALYGLGLHKKGEVDKLNMIMRNISQYVVQDEENQTAWLNMGNGGYWWYWYGSEIEAHAAYLKLLCATDPKGELAPRLVKYLLNNRKHATYWASTRDTALCVEAFGDFLEASGESKPNLTVTIAYDGQTRKKVQITPEMLFTFDNTFLMTGDAVENGKHRIEISKAGLSPLYYNAYLNTFTLEDFITKAGLEIKVERKAYRLVPESATMQGVGSRGQVTGQKVEKFRREELKSGDTVKSGDLIEIELLIASKNDYEYIIVEDMKAAGCEPVDLRSGYTGNEMGAYVEFRDERVAFFVRRLARGEHSVSYRVRAEIPGRFSALPTRIRAMYAPELRGNSDELKLRIAD